ncbi:MAG: DUF3035 domain-containing protein [Alphaproteobacteria bacterium]
MSAWKLAVGFVAVLGLAGCETVKDSTGGSKMAPDEFAVAPKAPLVMPPDFNLRPPKPGSRMANLPDPSDQARASLYPHNPAAVAATIEGGFSDGERLLLAYAGAANADNSIRQRLAADAGYEDQGPDFSDKILFWQAPADQAQPVDAAAEAERLRKSDAGEAATNTSTTQ